MHKGHQLTKKVLCHLLGVVVYEYELKIGWGKSVSLPSQALPAPPPGHMAIRSKEVGYNLYRMCAFIM